MSDGLEMLLRGGAATTFVLLSVILLRDGGDRTLARLGALFALSTAWWALNTPALLGPLGPWTLPLFVLSHGKAAAFWLFARALFEDGFRMRPRHWALWGAMAAVGGLWMVSGALGLPSQVFQMPHQIAQMALAASAAWIAWRGRGGDLVEPRRRVRIAFVLLSSLFMIGITASYIAPGRPHPIAIDLNVVRMFVMAVGMALLVAGLRSDEIFARSGETAAQAAPPGGEPVICADPAEGRLLARLRRLMEEERAYRREGLTIGALAARLETPEYALRRLINGRLGHRNFNSYLNGWRLADAKAALSDPGQREVPISTIALDAGFRSLGPFNRAFKAAEGVTPSEFRDEVRAAAAPGEGSPVLKSA